MGGTSLWSCYGIKSAEPSDFFLDSFNKKQQFGEYFGGRTYKTCWWIKRENDGKRTTKKASEVLVLSSWIYHDTISWDGKGICGGEGPRVAILDEK